MSLAPPGQNKSWWSRSKSRDPPSLRLKRSNSNLGEKAAASGPSKPKESRFNTLVASAMGKKKKQLPIQDPPPPAPPMRPPRPPSLERPPPTQSIPEYPPPQLRYQRPPRVDIRPTIRRYHDADEYSDPHTISEPRTPSDHPRDRSSYQNSVMTLSDPDPFASGGIFSPLIQDPNRLSVYSDASYHDAVSKRSDPLFNNRISGQFSPQLSPPLPTGGRQQALRIATDGTIEHQRHRRQSSIGLDEAPLPLPQNRTVTRSRSALHSGSVSSNSTVTPTERGRTKEYLPSGSSMAFPQPPSLRARGMTVGSLLDRPNTSSGLMNFTTGGNASTSNVSSLRRKASENFLLQQSPVSPSPTTPHSAMSFPRSRASSNATNVHSPTSSRPVVLIRKASAPRMIVPPPSAAPPISDLPSPPPHSPGVGPTGPENFFDPLDDSPGSLEFQDRRLSSSSSLSFASGGGMGTNDVGDAIQQLMRDSFGHRDRKHGKGSGISTTIGNSNPGSRGSTMRPNSLKKAASQQNLFDKRQSLTSLADSLLSDSVGHDSYDGGKSGTSTPGTKTPKKQRSFHHPRFPPLSSLRHPSSSSPSPPIETRKDTPLQPRRRLFSGSSLRRYSSSQPQPPGSSSASVEDDMRSLLSVESISNVPKKDHSKHIIMSFSSFGNQMSLVTESACLSPTWDEDMIIETASKRDSQSDYAPQHIMSPDAMLELEQQIEADAAQREREKLDAASGQKPTPKLPLDAKDLGLPSPSRRPKESRSRVVSGTSDVSTLTGKSYATASEGYHAGPSTLSRTPTIQRDVDQSTWMDDEDEYSSLLVRSTSMFGKTTPKPPLAIRPATAQPLSSPPTTPTTITASPERPITVLPPPPRPRARVSHEEQSEQEPESLSKRASVTPIHPLSPPPRRKTSRTMILADDSDHRSQHSTRPPSAFETQKIMHRRSLMKKPSFLEISDEDDDEDDGSGTYSGRDGTTLGSVSPIMESSFLDLDRGNSFDSVRSDDNFHVF
ncbi:unnamed protein product [Somion occarium]|uniref:PpiC domain-containing protein n=1 Tax=Somion occarium TaxID=3059160 RepID=A0ABP1CGY4_9APHY